MGGGGGYHLSVPGGDSDGHSMWVLYHVDLPLHGVCSKLWGEQSHPTSLSVGAGEEGHQGAINRFTVGKSPSPLPPRAGD